jgi:hypothetical protein
MLSHEHSYNISKAKVIKVGLTGGRHTSFHLLACECGHLLPFPTCNFDIALAEGTEETIKMMKGLGLV